MEDKAISTDEFPCDNNASYDTYLNETTARWNILTMEKLLTALISTKIASLQTIDSFDSYNSESSNFVRDEREKEPPDKKTDNYCSPRSPQHHCHHNHHHHHHHHNRHYHKHHTEDKKQFKKYLPESKQWSEDLMETSLDISPLSEAEGIRDCIDDNKNSRKRKDYTSLYMEKETNVEAPKRKKRKRRRKKARMKKISQVDPDDLPKRARWTIITTAGLLILTCMFLVGITLRMAPVIDQMVRTKNEELMNSLNRNNNLNYSYYSSYYENPNR